MKKILLLSIIAAGMLTVTSCGNAPEEEDTGQHNIKVTKVADYLY